MTSAASLVRRVRVLCEMERRARVRGEPRMAMARRLARLVLQGILEPQEAAECLALIILGKRGLSTPEGVSTTLHLAEHVLVLAMEDEERFRDRVAREIGRACKEAMTGWAAQDAVLDVAMAANREAGRPFVWPEIVRLVEDEAARFIREQQKLRGELPGGLRARHG